MGLDNPTDRTFVAEDKEDGNKIVAFSRWMVPQQDGKWSRKIISDSVDIYIWTGNIERIWPELSPDEWDMELVEAFFGGMEVNRHELMGSRPHWGIVIPFDSKLN